MRRRALLLLLGSLVAACEPAPRGGERVARIDQPFTSNESVLVDFDLDGSIMTDTDSAAPDDATLRTLIQAQLMYSIGALNAERSVGRYERLELSQIVRAPSGAVSYHAHLPVAWGRSGPAPSSYELRLPARAGEADQTAFATKYGATCVDIEAAGTEPIHPERMFLFYRPLRPGCVLDTSDVVTLSAKVSPSTENTTGKYPELDRVWEDGTLRAVVLFSRAEPFDVSGTDDQGVLSYYELMTSTTAWARGLGATSLKTQGGNAGWSLAATLIDGRKIQIDARMVAPDLSTETVDFDAWYDARTPEADLVMYSGHAGLGWNVRTLMNKGVFRAGKYVIWAVNGCDTFAYVDRTLAKRRALLNPDDPSGTKYMDIVSNVMAAWFHTGAETTVTLLDGLVAPPKTYRDIFANVDPSQVITVTGDEDNVFVPKPSATPSNEPYPKTVLPEEPDDDPPPSTTNDADEASFASARGCSTASTRAGESGALAHVAFIAAAIAALVRKSGAAPRSRGSSRGTRA